MIPYCILAIEDESDREFMTSLYYQYQKLMYSTVQKILRDQWKIDDAVQTALERLINKIPLLRTFDRIRLVSYIVATCKNTAYNLLRYDDRHETYTFDEMIDSESTEENNLSIEDRLLLSEKLEYLAKVWNDLDQRSQYLLEARYILDKELSEIASDLGIKTESVRMALTRARKKAYGLIVKKMKGKTI